MQHRQSRASKAPPSYKAEKDKPYSLLRTKRSSIMKINAGFLVMALVVTFLIASKSSSSIVEVHELKSFCPKVQSWLLAALITVVPFGQTSPSSNYEPPVESVFRKSEMASLNDLTPDLEFIASDKYKRMEKYIKSKYDYESLRKSFIEKGYISYKPDIPESTIDAAAEFTKLCDDNRGSNFHQDRFTDIDAVREIALNYDIQAMLAVLHGYDPYPFQTLNYPRSSMARTHSDYIHFAAHPVALMSAAWVALMDINPDAGPVFYYEGSHKLAPFNMQDFGLDDRSKHRLNYAKYQDIMTATMKKLGYKYGEAVVKKGEVFIWSANLVHGGPLANDPSLLRLSQVTHYFFRNSNYNWAPVASEVDANAVTYYNEKAVDQKFGTKGTSEERRALSKFLIASCDYMTKDKPNIPNPCDIPHRIPQVLSQIFEHKGEKNNDVIM